MSTGARKRNGVLAISGCFTKCHRSFGESFDAERIANSQLRSQWCSQPSARLCCCLCVVCEARVAIRRTNYRGGRAAIRFFQRFHFPFPSSAALEKSLFSRPRFSSFVFSDLALFSPFYFTFLKTRADPQCCTVPCAARKAIKSMILKEAFQFVSKPSSFFVSGVMLAQIILFWFNGARFLVQRLVFSSAY